MMSLILATTIAGLALYFSFIGGKNTNSDTQINEKYLTYINTYAFGPYMEKPFFTYTDYIRCETDKVPTLLNLEEMFKNTSVKIVVYKINEGEYLHKIVVFFKNDDMSSFDAGVYANKVKKYVINNY